MKFDLPGAAERLRQMTKGRRSGDVIHEASGFTVDDAVTILMALSQRTMLDEDGEPVSERPTNGEA